MARAAAPRRQFSSQGMSVSPEQRAWWLTEVLGPVGFTALVVGGSVGLAELARRQHWLSFGSQVSKQKKTEYAVYGLIAANVAVFALWQLGFNRARFVGSASRVLPFMERHFLASAPGATRPHTLLTSTFSHMGALHLGLNMYVLWTFSHSQTVRDLGAERFLAFYTSAAVASSLIAHGIQLIAKQRRPGLGASGAVCAVVAASLFYTPQQRVGIILLPFSWEGRTFLPWWTLFEACGTILLFTKPVTPIGHHAHLGGILFGVPFLHYMYVRGPGNRKPPPLLRTLKDKRFSLFSS